MRVILLVAFLMGWLGPVSAAGYATGNLVHKWCSATDDRWAVGACNGYSLAVADTLYNGDSVGGHRACIPKTVASKQVFDIAKVYLENHPEDRHFAAERLIAQALSEAWPCPKK